MAIVRVQVIKGGGPGTSSLPVTALFGSSVTSGNTVIVIARNGNVGASFSVTDTFGSTYTNIATYSAADPNMAIWYAVMGSSGSNTISLNLTGGSGSDYTWVYAIEVSGLSATPFDTGNIKHAAAATTDLTTDAFSTAQASEYVVVGVSQSNLATYSAGTDFTLVDGTIESAAGGHNFGGVEEYITSGTLSSYSAHITSNDTASDTIAWAAFKAAAAGGDVLMAQACL